jgi:hypothetical protein
MKTSELKAAISAHPEKTVRFVLPTGTKLPIHAHVTEVARVEKKFVDCGGTLRADATCRLQTWVADDTDHRLDGQKLSKIFQFGEKVLAGEDLELEVECEAPFIAHFPVVSVSTEGGFLLFNLATKHTACLAEDQCCPPPAKRGAVSSLFKPLPEFRKSECCE